MNRSASAQPRYLAALIAGKPCWYADEYAGIPPCSSRAVFSVLKRGFDAIHPDPDRDHRYCCREHLAVTVELTDEESDPGCTVHVSVLSSVTEKIPKAKNAELPS